MDEWLNLFVYNMCTESAVQNAFAEALAGSDDVRQDVMRRLIGSAIREYFKHLASPRHGYSLESWGLNHDPIPRVDPAVGRVARSNRTAQRPLGKKSNMSTACKHERSFYNPEGGLRCEQCGVLL